MASTADRSARAHRSTIFAVVCGAGSVPCWRVARWWTRPCIAVLVEVTGHLGEIVTRLSQRSKG